MACATLKRSLDWDHLSSPSNSPPGAGSGDANSGSSSMSPTSSSSISPRPAKRLCSSHVSFLTPLKGNSPFGDVEPKMTTDAIHAKISEEFRRLHARKQLSRLNVSPDSKMTNSSNPVVNQLLSSPAVSMLPAAPTPCNSPALGLSAPGRREQPLFTFKQVSLICERLLREREQQIREEYDQILGAKLAEQYDTFVKFTYDQIQKRFDSNTTPSYLSWCKNDHHYWQNIRVKKDARNVVDIKLSNNNWGQHYSVHIHNTLTQYCTINIVILFLFLLFRLIVIFLWFSLHDLCLPTLHVYDMNLFAVDTPSQATLGIQWWIIGRLW